MDNGVEHIKSVLRDSLNFMHRVLSGFRANQGFLLSGAVAYYTLLSIVPLFALILVVLSLVLDKQQLLETTRTYLGLVAPGESDVLTQQIAGILDAWKLIGVLGLGILLFFSSLAFTVFENAIMVIFQHRVAVHRRHFLISAILPFCYMCLLAIGLFILSVISSALHAAEGHSLIIFGYELLLDGTPKVLIYLLGVFAEILLLSLLYLLMPVGQLPFRHALIGGITATILWEITRQVLLWYFSTLSIVNIIYGSFASAIVILLSFEIGAIILLLGAQVIAEYECIDRPAGSSRGLRRGDTH